MFCHHCGQVVDAPDIRADAAVRCPRCLVLTHVPGSATRSTMELSGAYPRVGLGWPGYVVIALIVAATAVLFVFFRGHVQQQVLSRVLPRARPGAIRVLHFYCTNALPAGTNSSTLTLGTPKEKAGRAYLVVQVSVDSAAAEVERLTERELEEVRQANPNARMTNVWVSWPSARWFRIVGPRHALSTACAHQAGPGQFSEAPAWNSPPSPDRPERVEYTVCFEVERRLAEAGRLSFQYRWRRPVPLKRIEGEAGT